MVEVLDRRYYHLGMNGVQELKKALFAIRPRLVDGTLGLRPRTVEDVMMICEGFDV